MKDITGEKIADIVYEKLLWELHQAKYIVDFDFDEDHKQRTFRKMLPDIKKEIRLWIDIFQLRHFSLKEDQHHTDFVALLTHNRGLSRRENPKRSFYNKRIISIAVSKEGRIEILVQTPKYDFLKKLSNEISSQEADLLRKSSEMEDVHNAPKIGIYDDIFVHTSKNIASMSRNMFVRIRKVLRGNTISSNVVNNVAYFAQKITQEVLEKAVTDFAESFYEEFIDDEAYKFCCQLKSDYERSLKNYSVLDFYNFIVRAGDQKAKEFRMGALSILCAAGKNASSPYYPITDSKFQEDVDLGLSPYEAMGGLYGVSKNTVKKMFQHQNWAVNKENFANYAYFFEAVDFGFWPNNLIRPKLNRFNEAQSFKAIIDVVEIYAKTFDKEMPDVLGQWLKEKWTQSGKTWYGLLCSVLSKDLENLFQEPANGVSYKKEYEGVLLTVFAENKQKKILEVLHAIYSGDDKLFRDVLNKYSTRLKNISDMKNDISKRLTTPFIIVALKKQGFDVIELDSVRKLSDRLAAKMWAIMSPSDQVQASDYWHSPAVNISRRFNSAAMNEGAHPTWSSLIDAPYQINKNTLIIPLNSNIKLRAEADEMSHCIWSYGSYFYSSNYHMFSIRRSDGRPLTSLTVKDYFDDNGKRKIKEVYNLGRSNTKPSEQAIKAAEEFIEVVNSGDVTVPWDLIDEDRAEYKVNQVENAAGYDIFCSQTREAVCAVYKSCLPKKIFRGQEQPLADTLYQFLDIENEVDKFLQALDLSALGLRRTRLMTRGSVVNEARLG